MPPTINTPTFVSAIPALAGLGIGRTRAYEILNDGLIPAKKVGIKTMVRPEDVAAYAASLPAYPVAGRPKAPGADRLVDPLAAASLLRLEVE